MLVVLFGAAPQQSSAQVNCATTTVAGVPATLTPTVAYQTVTTQSGRYYSFAATAGCTYTFTHCSNGGAVPVGTDPALSLTDASNNILSFNDDGGCGNGGATIVWTCGTTGTYRIHHEKCCCSQVGASNFATMAYKVECPCDAGVASANVSHGCMNDSVTLTLSGNSPGSSFQWQFSFNNGPWSNVSGGIYSPFDFGPLNPGIYSFRAVVTCNGTNNTVGMDTTNNPVLDTINALPVVIFPGAGPQCLNAGAVTLTATPTGGSYSGGGGGLVGNTWNPLLSGAGTFTIIYDYTDGNGCSASASQAFTGVDTPAVTFLPFPNGYCINDPGIYPIIPMNLVTPTGGSYAGTGLFVVADNIIPGNGTVGNNNPVCYTYNDGTCSSVVCQPVTIYASPVLNFPNPGSQCLNGPCVQLNATPAGGTYSGSTLVSSSGLFCPTAAGAQTVTYTYTDGNGCSQSQSINITVFNNPVIVWNNLFPNLCQNSPVLNMDPYADPNGGVFTSTTCPTAVTGNNFNPAGQNGTCTITYTLTQNGCTSASNQDINVDVPPTVTFNGPVPPVCAGSAPFMLTGYVTPAGGTFSNTTFVTTAGQFTPSTAGTYNVIYTYVDPLTGCGNTVTFPVTVNALPNNVSMPGGYIGPYCSNGQPILLNMGIPGGSGPGNDYSGPGVSGPFSGNLYYFNPTIGADTFVIYYEYTNGNGCSATDSGEFVVLESDMINFPPIAAMCESDPSIVLQATPAGGTFSGTNVVGNVFNPSGLNGTYQIRYIYNSGQCIDTAYQNVTVNLNPGNITTSNHTNPTFCGAANGSFRINGLAPNTVYQLTYNYNGAPTNGGTIVSSNVGTYTVTGLIAGTYTLIEVMLGACSNTNTVPAVILSDPNAPAPPTVGSNSPLCQFSTLQLTASSGTVGTYTWTGPNSFFSAQQNPSIVNVGVAASGPYNVTITDNMGCTSQPSTVTVVVNPAPNLTVNSNSPVCMGNTITLQASSTTGGTTYQWTGPNSFLSIVPNPTITNASPANDGWYVATATGPNLCTRKDSVDVVVGTVIPTTPTAGANTPVCSGTNLNLTATNSTAGATYVWSGPTGYSANTQNPVRPAITVADSGDYFVYTTLDGCNSGTSMVHVSVIQSLTPNITITADPSDTVCYGTNINFTSVITDGGTSPIYQWYKNGVPVIGAIDSFWGSPYLTDLDTIYCVLVNATTCTTASADTSNKIAVHMAPNTIPSVLIDSWPLVYAAGQPMTFTAHALNAGTSPSYQWYLNGAILAGETAMTYNSSTLVDTDILSVVVTSNAPCAIPDTSSDTWNAIVNLSVTVGGKVVEDMKLFPNPNNGTFILSGTFSGMTGTKDAAIEVVNAVGQVVYKDQALVNNGKLDKQMKIADIAPGMYIIRIQADGQTTQMRFVVSK